jgi:hypothetical protein
VIGSGADRAGLAAHVAADRRRAQHGEAERERVRVGLGHRGVAGDLEVAAHLEHLQAGEARERGVVPEAEVAPRVDQVGHRLHVGEHVVLLDEDVAVERAAADLVAAKAPVTRGLACRLLALGDRARAPCDRDAARAASDELGARERGERVVVADRQVPEHAHGGEERERGEGRVVGEREGAAHLGEASEARERHRLAGRDVERADPLERAERGEIRGGAGDPQRALDDPEADLRVDGLLGRELEVAGDGRPAILGGEEAPVVAGERRAAVDRLDLLAVLDRLAIVAAGQRVFGAVVGLAAAIAGERGEEGAEDGEEHGDVSVVHGGPGRWQSCEQGMA